MMRIQVIFNRIFIVTDVLKKVLFSRNRVEKNEGKNVVIVFQQLFGDSIIIQNSLKEYEKIYSKEDGYNIIFLGRPSVIEFMEDVLPLPKSIKFEKVDFRRFLEDFRYFRDITKKYSRNIDILIVPGTSLSAEIFSIASDAKRKIGLIKSMDTEKSFLMKAIAKLAYTEEVRPLNENMMLQRHRLLLNYLGALDYKAKLPTLLPKDKIISENHYCVICPGSSKLEKCWPTDRFSKVIEYIIEEYDMNIHLCGGADEIQFERDILAQVKYPERIISHIGKTNFSDWSAIVQHSELVIGNDSATIHLAVAGRKRAICITGVYDKYLFFPYKTDALDDGDCLPVTLFKDMPCEWCRTIGYNAGFGNIECKKRIKADRCACCIDLITIEDVKEQIDLLMK